MDKDYFIEALRIAKGQYPPEMRWRVVEQNHKNQFITAMGSTFGIDKDGNIGGLCRNKFDAEGTLLLKNAVMNGGRKLQAFGKGLFGFYTRNHFRPISWTPFNPNMAPDGWKEEYPKDPLIFYAYDKNYHPIQRGLFFLFMCTTAPSKDADEAYEERDKWIKDTKKKRKSKGGRQ